MDLTTKNPKPMTPVKESENSNPNISSPYSKPRNSPLMKSVKSTQKSTSKNPNPPVASQSLVLYSPRNRIRERKFVVARKKSKKEGGENPNPAVDCKCKDRFGGNVKKCLCVAYETLRASQEEFFKNRRDANEEKEEEGKEKDCDHKGESDAEDEEIEKSFMAQRTEIKDGTTGFNDDNTGEVEQLGEKGTSTIKRRREKLLEEARNSVPESGLVKHLVKAFEKLTTTIPKSKESEEKEEEGVKEDRKKTTQWALPGLQLPKVTQSQEYSSSISVPGFQPPDVSDTQKSSSFCPSDFFLTSENLGLESRHSISSSWDGSQGSIYTRTSTGGRRSRRNSSESCSVMGGKRWKKKHIKVTSQKPFKLRTEQRGRMKEEEFAKKVEEMMMEAERLRIPIAQGLPWTTDEPECLIKPPVKEITRPVDLKLHSDFRAVERAEFDHQVAEKLTLVEQYKLEREKQQKMAEEEETRRLRKELVPKAQPMPYFDKPFVPRRSTKHPTVPKEPKFHIPHHKKIKCCVSWNDMSSMSSYSFQE